MNKIQQVARRSLWAFCIFAAVVLALRHVAADHRQENRIEALEVEVQQLSRALEQHEILALERLASSPEEGMAVASHERPAYVSSDGRQGRPASVRSSSSGSAAGSPSSSSPSASAVETETLAERADRVVERLTQEPRKFTEPMRLELNVVDSVTLVRVPGIGGMTASVILRYRERLGGFSSPEQLRECIHWESAQKYMDGWVSEWFKADENLIKKSDVNHLSFKELLRHPYLTYDQVGQLCRRREKVGSLRSLEELRQLDTFGPEDLERLRPYLQFE